MNKMMKLKIFNKSTPFSWHQNCFLSKNWRIRAGQPRFSLLNQALCSCPRAMATKVSEPKERNDLDRFKISFAFLCVGDQRGGFTIHHSVSGEQLGVAATICFFWNNKISHPVLGIINETWGGRQTVFWIFVVFSFSASGTKYILSLFFIPH